MNKPTVVVLIISIGILLISGCGIYSFSGSTLPPHLQTIGIPLLEDQTTEFGIDQSLTDTLIDAFIEDNSLKIDEPRSADCVLTGTITRVEDRTGQYSSSEVASDFRVSVTVKVKLEDMRKRQTMFDDTISQYGTYDGNEVSREEGIEEALEKIATDILNRALSDW